MTITQNALSERAAIRLSVLWYAWRDAERPIDKKVARANFYAACGMLDALGIVRTETDAFMRVSDAFRATAETYGVRPGYRSVNNQEQRDWDKLFTDAIMKEFARGL